MRIGTLAATAVVDSSGRGGVDIILHPGSVVAALVVAASASIALCGSELLLSPDNVALSVVPSAGSGVGSRVALLQVIASADTKVDDVVLDAGLDTNRPGLTLGVSIHL